MKNLMVAAAAAALLGGTMTAQQAPSTSLGASPSTSLGASAKPVPSGAAGSARAASPNSKAAAPSTTALPVDAQNQLVGQYCATCHSERGKAGGLTLAGFDAAKIGERPDVAEKMIRKLRTGMMPPPNARRPEAGTIHQFVDALEAKMDAGFAANPNPGWRPFQR